jgi:hypothetical protein
MELLLELAALVGQFLLEILLQFLFEILAEFGLVSVREAMRLPKPARPLLGFAGYIVLGGALGGVSVWCFRTNSPCPYGRRSLISWYRQSSWESLWLGLGDGVRVEISKRYFFTSSGLVSLWRWSLRWCVLGLRRWPLSSDRAIELGHRIFVVLLRAVLLLPVCASAWSQMLRDR